MMEIQDYYDKIVDMDLYRELMMENWWKEVLEDIIANKNIKTGLYLKDIKF